MWFSNRNWYFSAKMLSQWAWAMFEMKCGDVITDGDFKIEISSPGSVRDQILDSNRFWVLPQLFAELKWAENWDDNLIRVKVAKLPSFNLHKRHVQTANRPYKSAPLVKWHKMLNYSDPKLRLKMVNSVSKKDKSNNYASQKDIQFISGWNFGIFQLFHIKNYGQNRRVFSIKLNEILDSKKWTKNLREKLISVRLFL